MRLRFGLSTMLLAVFFASVLLWFLSPVASIDSETCARIQPGMTLGEVHEVVGVKPGWYDGVDSIDSDSPLHKAYDDEVYWVGVRGEIYVDFDDSGRVAQATFYPARSARWSLFDRVWERFTRIQRLGLSLSERVVLYLALASVLNLTFGLMFVRRDSMNSIAQLGQIGLAIGPVLSMALFSDIYSEDLLTTSLVLTSPISGAVVGILVGFCRSCAFGSSTEPGGDHPLTSP